MATPFDEALGADPMSLWMQLQQQQQSPMPPPMTPFPPQMAPPEPQQFGIPPEMQVQPPPMAQTPPIQQAPLPMTQEAIPPSPGAGPQGIPGVQMAPQGVQPPGFMQPPQQGPDAQRLAYRRAMQAIESGDYNKITDAGRGRRVYGAYQVLGENIPEWTRRWYGRALSEREFLGNREAQDAVFDGQFGEYVQRFGSPEAAAQAWIGGPGGVGRNSGPDRFGTTPVAHGRNFMSALSRIGVQQPPGFTPQTMGVSPEMAAATGQQGEIPVPGMLAQAAPAPLSPQATALAPGLRSLSAAPQVQPGMATQPIQEAARRQPDAFGGFLNTLMGGDATRPAIAQGFLDYARGAPSGSEISAGRENAANAIIRRGQELRQENPGAAPQQIADMLLRDPIFGRNAFQLGSSVMTVLNRAAQPSAPPTLTSLAPGASMVASEGGVPRLTGVQAPTAPPDMVQMLQYIQSLPPDQQAAALSQLSQLRTTPRQPSEEMIALTQLLRQGKITEEQYLLALGNAFKPVATRDQYGNVTGQDTQNIFRAPGGGGTQSAPAAPTTDGVPPAAGGVTPPAPSAAGTYTPRVIGRVGDRDITDVPDLSLSSSTISNPAHIALGVGPVGAFRGIWGRVMGNVPGMAASEEETLTRQNLAQGLRSAYTTYRKGVRLAGEHAETMAEIPEPAEILSNPLRATNQYITAREQLVANLQLAEATARDTGLAAETRRTASNSVAEIRGVLMRFPSLTGLIQLSDQLRRGEELSGTAIPSVSGLAGQAAEAASRVSGGATAAPAATASVLPKDITDREKYSTEDLMRLSRREGLSPADAQVLIQELRERRENPRRIPRSQ